MSDLTDFIYTQPEHAYSGISEALVEDALIDLLKKPGWRYENPADIAARMWWLSSIYRRAALQKRFRLT